MKNCIVLYNLKYCIDIKEPKFLIIDPENSTRTLIANKNEIYCYNSDNKHLDKISELSDHEGEIVSFEYLSLSNDIVIATETGVVLLVNLHHKSNEEVTFCEGGIEKMSWSPDQEVVVFITKSKLLVVMSCSYDPISEITLDDMNFFGDGEFITVGWGKKETQFHGTAGKQAAKEKTSFVEPENMNKLCQEVNISWRADGEFFAVSFVGNYGRMFKVFNREGMLQYTSEKLNDLGECIAWRPSGNWIAVPHSFPNKYTVGLFEKNGLRHRELILPFSKNDECVINLSWSNDSEILVVQTEKEEKINLYFYTIGNYHWYLKNLLTFDKKVQSLVWDSGVKQNKKLHILLENGQYFIYRWHFSVQYSHGENKHNQAVISVIDAKTVLLTDFRNVIIPPPMSNYKYEHTSYIIACGFLKNSINEDGNLNKLFLVDSSNNIFCFEIVFEEVKAPKSLKLIKLYAQNYAIDFLSTAYQFLWINENNMIICKSDEDRSEIFLLFLNDNTKALKNYKTNGIIGNIAAINSNEFLVDFTHGETQIIKVKDDDLISSGLFINEGVYCQKIECVVKENSVKLIGLNDSNNLYINGIKISEDVTSFFSIGNYLAFTQLSCLKFFRYDLNKVVDERKIERGGKLVTIVSNDSKTILQMPRGNLEAICPRILSLEIVGKYLDNLEYFKTFDFLRKQRINLNIIFDHNPLKFIENLDIFLNEITNENWLNLFISELQNDDFAKTMYKSNYIECKDYFPENYKVEEKVKFICQHLCKKMEQRDALKNMLPIITTYVKLNNLEKSLEIIWNQKQREIALEQQNNENVPSDKFLSEKALKYLLYLVDVNELYNVALGMYDFSLVIFVATKSQKDPKEYIPFLNDLKKLEENYRKFKIDLHLKRFEKALNNIAKCETPEKFEEALEFIIDKKLYQKALQVYEYHTDNYKKICMAYGDYLRAQGKLANASLMYERANDLKQAILSAKHVVDWKRCLKLTNILHNGDKEELKIMALSLVVSLEEIGKFDDAFFILKNFADNFERGINSLLKGHLFNKALYEVKISSNESLEQDVISSIVNYYDVLLTSIMSDQELFLKYKNRLLVVRKLKYEKEDLEYIENGVDECDLVSDTTSVNSSKFTRSSKGTGKTFRSSKNRRKHERKLLSLKEGNPFEDIALIDAIHNLIIRILNQQEFVHDICQSFIEIRRDDLGRNVQKQFNILLNFIKESLDIIWIVEMQTNAPQLTGNIDYVQYQNAQHYAVLNPLKRFKPELNFIDWEHDILR